MSEVSIKDIKSLKEKLKNKSSKDISEMVSGLRHENAIKSMLNLNKSSSEN